MRNADWVMQRIASARPKSGGDPSLDVQPLVDTLLAFKRGRDLHVFGVVPAAVEADAKKQVIDATESALREWHAAFTRENNRFGLWELSKASSLIEMPDLKLDRPFPLACDPLGDPSKLDALWTRRLDLLRAVVAGRAALRLEGAGYEPKQRMVKLGAPNKDALYGQALRFETNTGQPFSRELAAWWTIADGISVDAAWFLMPAKQWTLHGKIEGGLIIGTGRFTRGNLGIGSTRGKNPCDAELVDTNDKGHVFKQYANFGELADAILP